LHVVLAISPAVAEEFPASALAAWSRIERDFDVARATLSLREPTGNDFQDSQITFKARGTSRAYIVEVLSGSTYKGEATVVNDEYAFELRRMGRDSPWVVSLLALSKDAPHRARLDRSLAVNEPVFRQYPLVLNHVSIVDVMKESSLRIIATRPTKRDNRDLVEVEFTVNPEAMTRDGVRFGFTGGTVALDPAMNWLPTTCKLAWPAGDIRVVEYSDFASAAGVPYPRKCNTYAITADGKRTPSITANLDALALGEAVAKSEFTLSAFGLPEPKSAGSNSITLMVALAGVVLLFLGAVLRWWRQKS
jgi:hypothetical protein